MSDYMGYSGGLLPPPMVYSCAWCEGDITIYYGVETKQHRFCCSDHRRLHNLYYRPNNATQVKFNVLERVANFQTIDMGNTLNAFIRDGVVIVNSHNTYVLTPIGRNLYKFMLDKGFSSGV